MHYMGRVLRSPTIPLVTIDDLNEGGYTKWWSPVDRLLGTFETSYGNIHLVNTLPWDGAPNGRVDSILLDTEPKNKSRVRDFLRDVKPLYSIVSEIIADKGPQPRFVHDPFPLVIISRYRDNIYICLANVPPSASGAIAHAISILLHSIYGIRLKWEPHGDRYVWGEGSIGVQGGELSLIRKGAFLDVPPPEDQEWEKWVDTSSPHAPMVWRSHFPSLLIKCVWYASNTECLRANLKSVLWGVGVKGYPARWRRGALRSFYYKAGLERVVTFKQLREWAVDGKEWRRCRPSA